MGGATLSKSLIQFSVDGHGCVPSLFFDLRPNYGGGNEDNGDLFLKVPCMLHSVTPQEPDPDMLMCVLESPAEAWIGSGLLQGQRH